jgi:hypothetical protein
MGYDVHITRASHWTESESIPISVSEWLEYVERDPEMVLVNNAVARVDGEPALVYESEALSVWTAFSGHEPDVRMVWFDHRDGEIVVKNPDLEILGKMKSIANHLRAIVIGDDGETY